MDKVAFRMNPDEERVLAMLDGNPISIRELGRAFAGPRPRAESRVRNALRRLTRAGKCKQIARGLYQ